MSISTFFKGKVILVTGGAGSIGSTLVKNLLKLEPEAIRILDNNETGLFDLEQDLQADVIRTFVGDVRDKERLLRAFEGVDIVFHAAALKHVPLCEYNPFDAVKTNVVGTQNVIDATLDREVRKVVLISTDKAVDPVNVMGATKLLAERLMISANNYKGKRDTAFSCVRFGNVLNTRGSVIPLFKKQISSGGPLTLTDPEMTRFMMSIPKAVDLVLKAAEMAAGGEIFILKMPVLRMGDLAEATIKTWAPTYGYNTNQIQIKTIGKRPGEKLYEALMTEEEAENAYENKEMFIVLPQKDKMNGKSTPMLPDTFEKARMMAYTSSHATLLDKEGISLLFQKSISD